MASSAIVLLINVPHRIAANYENLTALKLSDGAMYAESITACYKQSINFFPASSIMIYGTNVNTVLIRAVMKWKQAPIHNDCYVWPIDLALHCLLGMGLSSLSKTLSEGTFIYT